MSTCRRSGSSLPARSARQLRVEHCSPPALAHSSSHPLRRASTRLRARAFRRGRRAARVRPADHPLTMSVLLSWLRTAARAFSRNPAHSWTVALTLAVGIAFASATGVIARAIAFAGLPVRDADRVVVMWGIDGAGSFTHLPLAPLDVPPLAEAMRGVATVAWGDYDGASAWVFRATDGNQTPLRLRGTLAGGNYFELLGARPVLGRTLRPDDDVIGAERVIVLSHSAWRGQFGGDSSVIGRVVRRGAAGGALHHRRRDAAGLDVPRGVEFWTAFAPTAARNGSLAESPWNVDVFARLEPGATAEQARQVLERYYQTLGANGKTPYRGATATVRTLPDLVTGDVRPVFAALAAAAVLVLLVTGVNVSGLLLLRATSRRRELAVRAAIGAARGRLVRELIVEHAMLAIVGGMLGAALASALVQRLRAPCTCGASSRRRPRRRLVARDRRRGRDRGHRPARRGRAGARRIARCARHRARWRAVWSRRRPGRGADAPHSRGGAGGDGARRARRRVAARPQPLAADRPRPGDVGRRPALDRGTRPPRSRKRRAGRGGKRTLATGALARHARRDHRAPREHARHRRRRTGHVTALHQRMEGDDRRRRRAEQ